MTEDGNQKPEVRGRKSIRRLRRLHGLGKKGQKSEDDGKVVVGGRRSENRGRRSEGGDQASKIE